LTQIGQIILQNLELEFRDSNVTGGLVIRISSRKFHNQGLDRPGESTSPGSYFFSVSCDTATGKEETD
jgi:hypothetical protein